MYRIQLTHQVAPGAQRVELRLPGNRRRIFIRGSQESAEVELDDLTVAQLVADGYGIEPVEAKDATSGGPRVARRRRPAEPDAVEED